MSSPYGVLVMAYGGPASLDEIPGYLADIRAGRVTPRRVLDEITDNYRQIGGRSPLPEKTAEQIAALSARFAPQEAVLYSGMRHWAPWIEDTVGTMIDDGITKAVAIVLAPHFSKESIKKYWQRIQNGMDLYHGKIQWDFVESYHTGQQLIQAFAQRVRDGLAQWPESERDSVHVLFSAHSLPQRILLDGDPYQDQLHETAHLIAQAVGLSETQHSWCYQSAGRTVEPWLGPPMEAHLASLAAAGIKNVVSVPVGFVSDHVEILFDIDIKAQKEAKTLGIRLFRPPALNDDPLFIDELENVIRTHARSFS